MSFVLYHVLFIHFTSIKQRWSYVIGLTRVLLILFTSTKQRRTSVIGLNYILVIAFTRIKKKICVIVYAQKRELPMPMDKKHVLLIAFMSR